MNKKSILEIDDNPDMEVALSVLCTINYITCVSVLIPRDCLEKMRQQFFELVIQDMNFSSDMSSRD